MLTSVTNLAGQTYRLGDRVWVDMKTLGTVTEIVEPARNGPIRVKVDPDQPELVDARPVNNGSHPSGTFCEVRDRGLTMGRLTPEAEG